MFPPPEDDGAMAHIFLSHSSENNAEAIALRDWLIGHGWDDLFLDLNPPAGLKPGEHWQAALKQAAERCELAIFLVSPEWTGSQWSQSEFMLAKMLNKRIFGVIVKPTPLSDLPVDMIAESQLFDLTAGERNVKATVTLPFGDKTETVAFSNEGLERLRIGLIQAGLNAGYFAWPPDDDPHRAPYRGLEPLQAEDAGIFFGRDSPTLVGLDLLRGLREAAPPRLLVILGASGVGKSSFLRAGLLPRLARDVEHYLPVPVIRPQRAVLGGEAGLIVSLEKALNNAGCPRMRADIRKAIEDGPEHVASLFRDLVKVNAAINSDDGTKARKPPTLVLSIDQAEELFHGEGAEEARTFLNLLGMLAAEANPALIVLFTIRSDSFELLRAAGSLQGMRLNTLSLPPMPKGAYAEVIKGPAKRLEGTMRALKIEDALVDALLADIEQGGAKDALPLLAFTLERLYREHGEDGDLKLSEYEELGRVKGSIEAGVERALKAADANPNIPSDRETRLDLLMRGFIPWLAAIDPDTGSPQRRIARRREIPEESIPLIDLLIEQCLLTTDIDPVTGEATIEPAHEALLRQWGLLQSWLEENAGQLSVLESILRAARDWMMNERDPDWLAHAGRRLEVAEKVTSRRDLADRLSADDGDYLRRCREQQERRLKDAEALAAANAHMAVQKFRKVFISYRRDDSGWPAHQIHQAISEVLGQDNVFIDVDSIGLGHNFREVLQGWIDKSDVLLALIGPHWIDAVDPRTRQRRLNDPNDFVRVEIGAALACSTTVVVPLLLDGTQPPPVEYLPNDLKGLVDLQAEEIRIKTFVSDVARLIDRLGLEAPTEQ
jgi:hypothetical protein